MDASAFVAAVTEGDPDAARAALAAEPGLADTRDDAGVSVIARAVYAGRLDLAREIARSATSIDVFQAACIGDVRRVEELLEQSPDRANAVAPDGFGPLGFAAFFGHLELLELLLRHGADVNTPASNPMKVCPLHSAAAHLDPTRAAALARPLLKAGADPNRRQQGGFAPLPEAALNGNAELVGLLLEHGADPELENDAGATPIALATERGHADVARQLRERAG